MGRFFSIPNARICLSTGHLQYPETKKLHLKMGGWKTFLFWGRAQPGRCELLVSEVFQGV